MKRKYEQAMGPKGSMRRRTRTLLLFAAAIGVMIFYVAGASGTLGGGSTFSAENGKLDPTSPATHDWNHPVETITCPATAPGAGTNCGLDLVKDNGDNALGQGSKEDLTTVSVVDGSIPPSKDDLSRFYINHEKVGSNDFLYLAWERSNLLGSAHVDFELNKNPVGLTSSSVGTITLNRTAGDKLIDFDFSGSGTPVLAIHTWIVTGTNASADCEASNTYPCWGKGTVLPAGVAESSVNSSPVQDNNPPGNPRTLDGNTKNGVNSTFGEAAINLEAAGIFTPGTCTSFADAWLKSRSSGNSFSSELKDIIAPIPTSISNCGTIVIKKVTVPSPDATNTSFSFTPGGQIGTTGFSLKNGESKTYTNVLQGSSSSVAETVPDGWTLTSSTCDNGDPVTAITVAVGGTTTCTFTNTAKAKIIVKKVTVPSGSTQSFEFTPSYNSGTKFNLTDGGSNDSGFLAPGSGYSVAETPVTGWDLTSSTCDNGNSPSSITLNPGDVVTCTFTNTQRGTIIIKKVTVPSPDPTDSTFTFTPGGQIGTTSFTLKNGDQKEYDNVKPGAANSSSVAETVPAQFDLTSKTCDNGDPVTAITVAAGGTTTCTFTNTLKFGALKITKQSVKSGNAGLAGAQFHVTGPGGYDQTLTSGSDGTICTDGLLSGSYSVTETVAPSGYTIDNPNAVSVTVHPNGAKCTDSPYAGDSVTFSDTPKTNLTITVASQDTGPGGSNSTIQCVLDSDNSDIGNSPKGPSNSATVTANDLAPGNYTCKVNIDP